MTRFTAADNGVVTIQNNWSDFEHINRESGIHIIGENVAVSPEVARKIAVELVRLADEYDAVVPREPTFKQRLRDLHRGAVIRYIGQASNLDGAVYTKVYGYGSDVFVRSDAGTLGSRGSHYTTHSDAFLGSDNDPYTSTLFEIVFEGVE